MNQDLVRLDRFDGSNFTRWQEKVRFLLTALKIFYILDPTLAPLRNQRKMTHLKWLYDLYTNTNFMREIWEALENKLRKRILHKSEDYSLEEIKNIFKSPMVGLTKPMRFQRPIILEKGPCFVCGKPGHYARECRFRKDQKGVVVNAIDEEIIATLSDVCVVQGKVQGWWYDTCATVHVTYDKSLFKTFEDAKGDQKVQMGNEGNPRVTLINVLYVPDMNKNLVSGDLLGKPGIKAVFESDKLILSKSGNFVGKGLAHVGLSTIKRIVKCGLIACDTKKFEKLHSDLCELNGMLTRGGNRIPMKKNEISPYELWKGRKPNIGYFKVWECLAYCKKTDPNKTKLGPRAIKCTFVGYASNSKAYRLLDLESNVIIESREVEFFENLLSDSNSQVPTSVGESQEETPSKVVEQPIKVLGSDEIDSQRISFYLVEGNREDIIRKIPIVLQIEEDPKTYKEAMASRDVAFWKEAINDEMDSIMSNQTWELVDLPPGSKPIGCKWVFRRKYHTDGMIQTFKARLVAKGFKQREGIDYFDTYAPVARTTSIRILFALASIHNLFVHQMDVKTAFLNGDLNEEVYMEQPEGFVLLGNENKVCKLVKSLYGLKQAPKQWHEKFDHAILSDGFRHNNVDKCLYSKTCDDYMIIVCLYVDDMLILSDDMRGIIETKRFLSSTFKMKDLGEVDTILDNLSTTGWVFTLGGGAVSWGSKKQTCISHSTMEAMSIHCDSQATLARAYSGVYNGKSRHISIRHEVKLKAFNEIQSMCDKHLKGNKDAGRISPM
ncbi:hypothetical protein AAG906_013785 [Vitis piasezkii]